MPADLVARALALARGDGSIQVAPALPAATVILLRDEPAGVATYLMRRTSTMAFAAGMHVFPGGRLDDADLDPGVPVLGDPGPDRALVVCAVRETFEETGILLAVDASGATPVPDATWEADRRRVLDSADALGAVLRDRGLVIDPALIPMWAHWVTPEAEERRYDVRFFIAAVPPGQEAHDVSGEADRVVWMRPRDALEAYLGGRLAALPPTVASLGQIAAVTRIEDLANHAGNRVIQPLLPRPRLVGDGLEWDLVDARDGSLVVPMVSMPAGSEARGTRGGVP